MCPTGSPKSMQWAQVHRLQPCIMRGTRQCADLCLQAPAGCCTIRKQVSAIKHRLNVLKVLASVAFRTSPQPID